MILGLNEFKQINDQMGHLVGDPSGGGILLLSAQQWDSGGCAGGDGPSCYAMLGRDRVNCNESYGGG